MIRQVSYASTASSGSGGGDMTKAQYDKSNDGKVDEAETIANRYQIGSGGVNAFQIVYLNNGKILAADGTNITHFGKVLGIVKSNAPENALASVCETGEITNPAWNLISGASYFLISGGCISTNPPESGFIQKVGVAKNAKTLNVKLAEPIKIID